MIRRYTFFFSIFVSFAYLLSCQSALPCDDANGVQANLSFCYYSGTVLSDTLIDSLVVYALTDEPTLYFDGTDSEDSTIALPLSMLSDTSVYIFQFGKEGTDTLQFCYTQYTNMVSIECGFVNFCNLTALNTTHHLIDSIWISKELVEFGDEENVKIYF